MAAMAPLGPDYGAACTPREATSAKSRWSWPRPGGNCGPCGVGSRFSIKRRLAVLTDPKARKAIESRLEALGKLVQQREPGCALRDDSRMAWAWASNFGSPPIGAVGVRRHDSKHPVATSAPADVAPGADAAAADDRLRMEIAADRIVMSHRLHTETDYRYVAERVVDAIAQDVASQGVPIMRAYDLARLYAVPAIKMFYSYPVASNLELARPASCGVPPQAQSTGKHVPSRSASNNGPLAAQPQPNVSLNAQIQAV